MTRWRIIFRPWCHLRGHRHRDTLLTPAGAWCQRCGAKRDLTPFEERAVRMRIAFGDMETALRTSLQPAFKKLETSFAALAKTLQKL